MDQAVWLDGHRHVRNGSCLLVNPKNMLILSFSLWTLCSLKKGGISTIWCDIWTEDEDTLNNNVYYANALVPVLITHVHDFTWLKIFAWWRLMTRMWTKNTCIFISDILSHMDTIVTIISLIKNKICQWEKIFWMAQQCGTIKSCLIIFYLILIYKIIIMNNNV